jgi:hypothetical protein
MRKYFLGAFALAAVAMTATAVPALSADSGSVAVSVTAQAPAAPCLTVTPGAVDFGTLPFSRSNGEQIGAHAGVTITNCGTAGQNLLAATTDAVGPGGSWRPLALSGTADICTAPDRFYLSLASTSRPDLYLVGTPAPVLATGGGPPAVFPPGANGFQLLIIMPCQGSNGAGETKTLTATFTAVAP